MGKALKIQILRIRRRRFQHHLILKIMLKAIRIISISSIGWSSTGFNIGGTPGLRADRAKKCRRIKRPSPFFSIIRLSQNAVAGFPELMKRENNILKGHNT